MYGDYSRGHEPDRKRGRSYRRVLLQMGRPLLDSDVASMVDALLGEVRASTRALGCASGSTDLGFLVTPGRLLALFAEAHERLTVTQGTPDAWLDYRFRFLDRYPALHLAAPGGPARVTLPLLRPLDPDGPARAALWARVVAPTTIQLNGIAVSLEPESPDEPQRVEVATGGAGLDPLEVSLAADDEVWLYLLEQDEAAGGEPAFWVAPGTYQLDGLVADARSGGAFPAVSFPEAAGFDWSGSPVPPPPLAGLLAPAGLAAGTRLVAYLETWERHVGAVEDPGIREEALGTTDTSTRTELVAQVKLAAPTGVLPPGAEAAGAIRAAFADVETSGGQLTIEVPESTPTSDPCALPELAGYSGSDNRLYRVEVHEGGGLSQVRLKWSRDNGSEVHAARLDDDANLVFDPGTPLAGGDVVEVLSHVVDLGDDALATVSAGGFVPARRAVGQLAQLAAVEVASSADEVLFRLVDPDDADVPVELDDRYGELPGAVLKLRRWHGILDPQAIAGGGAASPGPHVLEEGVGVTLSSTGSYRPGQWWQYEARVRGENANGPWRPEPHGPERRFAPLALLEHQGAAQPLRLLAWLDERTSRACDLDADDVAFAGGRVGSASDTVQEALEELFERPPEIVDASCGALIVRPENDVQSVFDTIGEGEDRRVCFQPGTWEVGQGVLVENKGRLVISGAGGASVLRGGADAVLRFRGCAGVHVEHLTLEGGVEGEVGDGLAGTISALGCGDVHLEHLSVACGGAATRRMSAVEIRAGADPCSARVRNCRVEAGHAQVGVLVVDPEAVEVENNTIVSPAGDRSLVDSVGEPEVAGRIAGLAIDDVFVGETEEATNELLVGSPNVVVEAAQRGGRRRFIVHLQAWGFQFVTFSTTLGLTAAQWRTLFEANPIVGASDTPAPRAHVQASMRRFRRNLVAGMFERPSPVTIPTGPRAGILALASQLATRNSFAAGGQGIVVAGAGAGAVHGPLAGVPLLTSTPRPDALVVGNRIVGFAQGIHVGTSGGGTSAGLAHRVTIADNAIQLRSPTLAQGRHGIFVGNVFQLRVEGNAVELVRPVPSQWLTAGLLDAIRAHGTFGPLLQIRENSCIGTRNGVVAHAVNRTLATTVGWRWNLADNAHVGTGGVAEQRNW